MRIVYNFKKEAEMERLITLAQLFLNFANVIILLYALYRFLRKPHDDIERRLCEVEVAVKEIRASLLQGNDRFRNQDSTNEVLIHSTLALIEFEIQYCLTEKKQLSKDLEKVKEDLHSYLARRGDLSRSN